MARTDRLARTTASFCHYIVFDNKTAQAVEDRIGRCDESKKNPWRLSAGADNVAARCKQPYRFN